MNGAEIIALAAVIVSGVVGIATLGFNFWNSASERKQRRDDRAEDHREWYKRTLFDKRIAATQEAYVWVMRLNRQITASDPDQPNSEANRGLVESCREAREWYDNNAVFLHAGLPESSAFIGLLNAASTHASGHTGINVWQHFIDAEKEVRRRLDGFLRLEERKNA